MVHNPLYINIFLLIFLILNFICIFYNGKFIIYAYAWDDSWNIKLDININSAKFHEKGAKRDWFLSPVFQLQLDVEGFGASGEMIVLITLAFGSIHKERSNHRNIYNWIRNPEYYYVVGNS